MGPIAAGMAGLIGLAGEVAGSYGINAMNNSYNKKLLQYQYEENRHDALVAFRRQKELLDDQRKFELAYSDPAFQMQRYKAAGLNPNLVAGQISGEVNSPSVPSVASSSPGSAFGSNMQNPFVNLPDALNGIADTVMKIYQTKYTKDNIYSEIESRNMSNKQIDEAIKKMQADTALTTKQKDYLEEQIKDLQYTINEIRPRERRKLDDESNKAASEIRKLVQDIENTNQIFPSQLASLKENLSILKDNAHISKKNRVKFDKEYDHMMSNLEKVFKLDDVTLDNALNAAETSNLQTNIQADITREIKQMYDSIDPNEDSWSRVNKFIMGSLILLIQKELSGLPTGYQMYQSARDQRSHDKD